MSGPENTTYNVSIFDSNGRLVLTDKVQDVLNLQGLQQGVYTLIFLDLKNSKKFIKKIMTVK
ncbi:T9SS type A sorting domain-containing protein [Flagellimonas aquimarina]|uniref:T9SS type A sorting domain-containing protein n=1 Tax=Flagellimonas aquimarina TaxID=2201895 RepID=UPI003AB06A7F